jgi:hypothetical protein
MNKLTRKTKSETTSRRPYSGNTSESFILSSIFNFMFQEDFSFFMKLYQEYKKFSKDFFVKKLPVLQLEKIFFTLDKKQIY